MDAEKLGQLIRRYEEVFLFANRKLNSMLSGQLSDDVTSEQYKMLRLIKHYGPCTSSKLSEINQVNRSAITAMIDRLVAKGYVERLADPQDRRVTLLETTPAAERVLQEGEEKIRQFVGTYMQELEDAEIETFVSIYEKIWRIINQKEGN
ncbi:MarR family winged helix-turn-helix transcriptional regulator [Ectobacillus ponti]|uniref:MarR family transcriptional regulator n=1 Tax=Ectobacillus ponti TaxID=2961894 RepID=A0AA42BP49_9BACI|nr:MarR family transcriptional regulator [Ectobacillus ponti]MCP8968036.1 MarR family transcriptional regulator [Ectobacillus ponti]